MKKLLLITTILASFAVSAEAPIAGEEDYFVMPSIEFNSSYHKTSKPYESSVLFESSFSTEMTSKMTVIVDLGIAINASKSGEEHKPIVDIDTATIGINYNKFQVSYGQQNTVYDDLSSFGDLAIEFGGVAGSEYSAVYGEEAQVIKGVVTFDKGYVTTSSTTNLNINSTALGAELEITNDISIAVVMADIRVANAPTETEVYLGGTMKLDNVTWGIGFENAYTHSANLGVSIALGDWTLVTTGTVSDDTSNFGTIGATYDVNKSFSISAEYTAGTKGTNNMYINTKFVF